MFLLVSNYTVLKAQSGGCGSPTCEEPGDPGLTSDDNNKLSVYPNPTSGTFNLDTDRFSTGGANISVIDSNGKVVL